MGFKQILYCYVIIFYHILLFRYVACKLTIICHGYYHYTVLFLHFSCLLKIFLIFQFTFNDLNPLTCVCPKQHTASYCEVSKILLKFQFIGWMRFAFIRIIALLGVLISSNSVYHTSAVQPYVRKI